jgi:hypothetical protein
MDYTDAEQYEILHAMNMEARLYGRPCVDVDYRDTVHDEPESELLREMRQLNRELAQLLELMG